MSILFGAEEAIGDWLMEPSMQFFKHRQRVTEIDPRDGIGPVTGPPDHRGAYSAGVRQGLRDERARHRGHPLIGLLVALIAVVGVAVIGLAAYEGSFSRAGAVADQHLAVAADQAKAASADAAAKTGAALQDAGAKIQEKASNVAPANH